MSYDLLHSIFIVAAILSGIMFVVSILLFVLLRIPRVIGDLSGSTARKAIESIRNQNETTGDKTYRSSAVNRERGKLTDKISNSGRLIHQNTDYLNGAMATEKISTQRLVDNQSGSETTVLDSNEGNKTEIISNETTLLGEGTTILGEETALHDDATTVLAETNANETTVLSQQGQQGEQTAALEDVSKQNGIFEIEYDITFIHTDEEIA